MLFQFSSVLTTGASFGRNDIWVSWSSRCLEVLPQCSNTDSNTKITIVLLSNNDVVLESRRMLGELVLAVAIGGALGLVAVDGAWAASYIAADLTRPAGTPSYFREVLLLCSAFVCTLFQ